MGTTRTRKEQVVTKANSSVGARVRWYRTSFLKTAIYGRITGKDEGMFTVRWEKPVLAPGVADYRYEDHRVVLSLNGLQRAVRRAKDEI
jgi:hypothetical protein